MSTDPPETRRPLANTRYELIRQIARGGMADVYLARDAKLDRPVAVKVLFPELSVDRNFVERFRREAQAAANLSHPNIVSIYDWGEDDGTYFIVMEYIEGQPLSAVIRDEGPLLADRAADIGAEVAAALGFAHRNGVIHRDVKPGNVLITPDGGVKVTDFGIARAANTGDNLTQTGAVMGTATYFSPEQAQGSTVDARSDEYSLGVVLYEMVTGRPPFAGDGPMAVAYKHVNDPLPRPRSINPGLQPAFEAILMQTLAKDAGKRYGSVEELRADLLRFRQGRPVLAQSTETMTAMAPVVAAQEPSGPATMVVPVTEPEPPRSNTWMYAVLLVVLVGALAAVLFLLGRSVGYFGAKSGTTLSSTAVVPPGLVGKSAADAGAALTQAGLKFKEVDTVNAAPSGQVFKVDPPEGTSLNRGDEVMLSVSQGLPSPVFQNVDNVIGKTYDVGGKLLLSKGFKVAPITQASDTVAYGIILAQAPPPGTQARAGDTITLTISAGKAPVQVPDVTGRVLADATLALGQAGFFRYSTVHEASATVAKNTVIRTDPAAGTMAPKDTVVTIHVSSGPSTVVVPNVVGMTSADATTALTARGFGVTVQNVAVVSPTDDGRVQSQSPAGGSSANTGSMVTIQVGKLGP